METKSKKRTTPPRRTPGANARKQKAPHIKPRKNQPVTEEPARNAPKVVYLPPKPFKRSRFILHLATVVAVVLALVLGLSIFFKVGKVEVSGCSQYTPWQVQQASGISVGDQLLTFSIPRASGKIINALPYVKNVRIGISLPDTVKIEIVETRVTYAIEDVDGNYWLMDSDGKVVDQMTDGSLSGYTQIIGITLDAPQIGAQAKAWQSSSAATDADGNVVPVTVTAEQRLKVIIDMASRLEKHGIIGEVASIDVSNTYDIVLWYGAQYQVLLGDTSEMETKVKYLKSFLDDYTVNRPYESGILDITDPEWIEYESFYG